MKFSIDIETIPNSFKDEVLEAILKEVKNEIQY